MNADDFNFVATLLRTRSGLVITPDKTYLFDTRLMPIVRQHHLAGLDALVAQMRAPGTESLIAQVVDAMTTNETSFFRDRHPFDALKKTILPELSARRAAQKHLRIWSAACSTGQEAYSLAMLLCEHFPALLQWRIEIVGTDISPTVLARARDGVFSTFEVQRGLPVQLLVKYFTQTDEQWQIKPAVRKMVEFRPFNLLDSLSPLGRFDIVFCRNVLIYFDLQTKTRILDQMHARLAPDGVLILGGAESVFGLSSKFTDIPEARGIYAPLGEGEKSRFGAAAFDAAGGAKTASVGR